MGVPARDCCSSEIGPAFSSIVDVSLLYESPFTDVSPQGPDALFTPDQVDEIVQLLDDMRAAAMAA